jgi:hypothetical protein
MPTVMRDLIIPTDLYLNKDKNLCIPLEISGSINDLAYAMFNSYNEGELEAYAKGRYKAYLRKEGDEKDYGMLLMPALGYRNIRLYGPDNVISKVIKKKGVENFFELLKEYMEGKSETGMRMDVSTIYIQNENCVFQAHLNKEYATAILSKQPVREGDITPFADAKLKKRKIKVKDEKGRWMKLKLDLI